jgi:hypothetical protein
MKNNSCSTKNEKSLSAKEIEATIRSKCDEIIDNCKKERKDESFFKFEKILWIMVSQLGCLFFQLYLTYYHERISYKEWLDSGLYYLKETPVGRRIKTVFGEVRYWRLYMARKGIGGGGFYPLDAVLGLTRDGFSPLVMSLATKLATRVSFGAAVILFRCFYGWSPSSESIEHLVLGIGREASAYMEIVESPAGDGEILIIQCDGKATPTATEEELSKRRGKRKKKERACCQRHRNGKGKKKQKSNKKKRRKKGDKSKNGRSTTIIVMYTLKIGSDGLKHGPINNKVWASYAPRKAMFAWSRRQATKRGFPPETTKRIHILVDGEKCLYDGLAELFPKATFSLDIYHVEEKIWDIGRAFYKESSNELEDWVEEKRALLYNGDVSGLLFQLKEMMEKLSKRAKRDKKKREILKSVINYMEPRFENGMMNYKEYIEEDLPIASSMAEGAARYVIGERMDCSGMRWIPERAEALLHLRCIELNGDWDHFFEWTYYNRWLKKLRGTEKVQVRTDKSIDLSSYLNSDIPEVSIAG